MSAALRAPFPWFGGKSRAAAAVWSALGDVDHYVEPFCGSAAVLLARPHAPSLETINDADGFVANFWRAVAADPAAVAHHADWPVNEADLHARHRWLIGERASMTERLVADPSWCDARIAGWWCWGSLLWIGDDWCRTASSKLPNIDARGGRIACAAPEVMPDTLAALSDRLRLVRVVCGSWERVLCPTTLTGVRRVGVFLDPPYATGKQQYAAGGTGTSLSAEAREWAINRGTEPQMRIVLAGYEGEHDMPAGWRCESWKANGGYGSLADSEGRANASRERLWLSPHCVRNDHGPLFGGSL